MIEGFLLHALAAGLGIAVVMGPFGTLIVWRRMAFFGASVAHSALLGVALGFLIGAEPMIGLIGVCIAAALLLHALRGRAGLAEDTLLGIIAHTALALGMVTIAFLPGLRIDLLGYLFGEILAIGPSDLAWIYGGGAAALAALAVLWRRLVAITVDEDLARVEGVRVRGVELGFLVLIALVIAVAMKVVGLLLVASMLIIPAAAARAFARTPEAMAALASLVGCLSVLGGLGGSAWLDLPSGPAIVVAAAILFALAAAVSACLKSALG